MSRPYSYILLSRSETTVVETTRVEELLEHNSVERVAQWLSGVLEEWNDLYFIPMTERQGRQIITKCPMEVRLAYLPGQGVGLTRIVPSWGRYAVRVYPDTRPSWSNDMVFDTRLWSGVV